MKSEILIKMGMGWPVSSHKWKAPLVSNIVLRSAVLTSIYKLKIHQNTFKSSLKPLFSFKFFFRNTAYDWIKIDVWNQGVLQSYSSRTEDGLAWNGSSRTYETEWNSMRALFKSLHPYRPPPSGIASCFKCIRSTISCSGFMDENEELVTAKWSKITNPTLLPLLIWRKLT